MTPKACVKTEDEILERRRRVSRRFLDPKRWKSTAKVELGLLTWRLYQRATGLAIPVAIGVLAAFILSGGGMPIAADLAGDGWPPILP